MKGLRAPADLLTKLLRRSEFDGECLIWLGSTAHDREGRPTYGKIWVDGRCISTHVAAYELLVEPIPDGEEIDHHCNRKLCWWPDHLETVPHRVNSQRVDWRSIFRNRDQSGRLRDAGGRFA